MNTVVLHLLHVDNRYGENGRYIHIQFFLNVPKIVLLIIIYSDTFLKTNIPLSAPIIELDFSKHTGSTV
jgi:hypothetical protein